MLRSFLVATELHCSLLVAKARLVSIEGENV